MGIHKFEKHLFKNVYCVMVRTVEICGILVKSHFCTPSHQHYGAEVLTRQVGQIMVDNSRLESLFPSEGDWKYLDQRVENPIVGTSLVVQWLRLCFHCRGHRFSPWSGN